MSNKIYLEVKENSKGILRFPKFNIETVVFVGKNGITAKKFEGDGKTPIGEFELGVILGIHSNVKNANGLKYKQITKDMYWVDDSKSKYYNKLVNILEVNKDWNSAEHLIEYPVQYEYLIEVKTNPYNIPGKGSAIFLHCKKDGSTAGCIAVDKNIMKQIVENIDEDTNIEIKNKNNN